MRYELVLALRYLKAKRKQAFISVITVISVAGVMAGVMALVVVLSVMNGFREDLTSKILGVNAHVVVMRYGGAFGDYQQVRMRLAGVDGVVASTPFVYSQVMVNNDGNASIAVLRGLDLATVKRVLDIGPMVREGSIESLAGADDTPAGLMLGSELAAKIGAHVGTTVTVIAPKTAEASTGMGTVSGAFTVSALFDSGMYDYDSSFAFLSLDACLELLGRGSDVSGLEVRVRDPGRADEVAEAIGAELGYPFWTRDWKRLNRNIFSMLEIQKVTLFIILAMIVVVGALSIVGTLVMVVMEKTKDIAILRTMGASSGDILRLFVFQGVFVGGIGTAAGLGAGLGVCALLARYRFITLPADVYWLSSLSVRVDPPRGARDRMCVHGVVLPGDTLPVLACVEAEPR